MRWVGVGCISLKAGSARSWNWWNDVYICVEQYELHCTQGDTNKKSDYIVYRCLILGNISDNFTFSFNTHGVINFKTKDI